MFDRTLAIQRVGALLGLVPILFLQRAECELDTHIVIWAYILPTMLKRRHVVLTVYVGNAFPSVTLSV